MTQIQVIRPYKYYGQWVFDDENTGLVREALISGADTVLDILSADIPRADRGILVLFSPGLFPSAQVHATWVREEAGGDVYLIQEPEMEAWLCPALLKYFANAPPELYVQVKPCPVAD